jgi:hypothetical protein
MKKKIKFRLAFLFTLGCSIILILFNLILSSNAIIHVLKYGNYAVNVDEQNIRKESSMFFLEKTRRTAIEHSIYFEDIVGLTLMLAEQIKQEVFEKKE